MALEYKTKTKDFIFTTWVTLDNMFLTIIEDIKKHIIVVGYKSNTRTGAKLKAIRFLREVMNKNILNILNK